MALTADPLGPAHRTEEVDAREAGTTARKRMRATTALRMVFTRSALPLDVMSIREIVPYTEWKGAVLLAGVGFFWTADFLSYLHCASIGKSKPSTDCEE
jgi:hypothetical protein